MATLGKAMGYRRPIVEFGNQTLGRRSLDDLTKEELYARAQDAGIPGRSEMTKEELVSALRSSDRASA